MPEMYRVYYKYPRASAEYTGGPWWCVDFSSAEARAAYLSAMGPVWESVYFLNAKPGKPLPEHKPLEVKPPRGATRVK